MDVVALGELLIDFTENGVSSQGNPLFEANPGGAPCNVLAMLSRLGHRTAFIGKVGNDFFGKQLEDAITEVGIDADGRRTAGGNNPRSKNLSFRNVVHDASRCPRSNEKSDRGRKRSRRAHFL